MIVSKVLKLEENDAWYGAGNFAVCGKRLWQFFDTKADRIQLSLHGTKKEAGVDSVSIQCRNYGRTIQVDGVVIGAPNLFHDWLLKELGTSKTGYLCVWEIP